MKTCPFCLKNNIQKYGKKNNIQRYFCSSRHKTFSFTKKLNPIDIWTDYTSAIIFKSRDSGGFNAVLGAFSRYL
ncbi:transposase-like zinc-binding domain-containing protein [Glaesserella parasuis]|uniref:transposase-like zinc-binding domain-containing protein n=1 Tax=Glaesserella parasuis TaxID=738 RepID=UPI0039F6BB60